VAICYPLELKLISGRNKGQVYVPSTHHLKRLGHIDTDNPSINLHMPVAQARNIGREASRFSVPFHCEQDICEFLCGLLALPVALQLAYQLDPANRLRACLSEAFQRGAMSLR
jgi:hypothetical protein